MFLQIPRNNYDETVSEKLKFQLIINSLILNFIFYKNPNLHVVFWNLRGNFTHHALIKCSNLFLYHSLITYLNNLIPN